MSWNLGKTLLIANPAAQNGNGAAAAEHAARVLHAELGESSFDVALTQQVHHAVHLGRHAGGYDTVVALGGDGIVHEVVNGLMGMPSAERPSLAVIPVGSGNDYARTLGMSFEVDAALRQLSDTTSRSVDVGCCNGEHFVETLSFGVDAAIALDTVERRKRTGKTGTMLYLASGIDQLFHHLDRYRYAVSFEGGDLIEGSMYLFAVQIGPTYGGGFRICPDALIDDGLLDTCIAHPPLSVPYATFIFLLARKGRHTGFRQLEFRRASSLRLRFDRRPPVQIDGEPFIADEYEISLLPRALSVLMPA